MGTTIQHDPRTKQQIKDVLYAFLYTPVEKSSKAKLSQLIMRNSSIIGNTNTAFTYRGKVYSIEDNPPYRKVNRLHTVLHSDMDEHIKEVAHLNNVELPYVVGFITSVLNASNSFEDYLKVFPSVLHFPIEQLAASCPCRMCVLTKEAAQQMQDKNKESISLIQKRMVMNLLI